MNSIQTDARKRIQKAIALLDEVNRLLGDGDDLERALAGQTSGMVMSEGHAKQATFLAFDARLRLNDALKQQK